MGAGGIGGRAGAGGRHGQPPLGTTRVVSLMAMGLTAVVVDAFMVICFHIQLYAFSAACKPFQLYASICPCLTAMSAPRR